jgi:hypothetical protein
MNGPAKTPASSIERGGEASLVWKRNLTSDNFDRNAKRVSLFLSEIPSRM